MDLILGVVWLDNRFLGIEWHFWKVIGWVGNLVFFSRFFVQWWATEKSKRVVVPNAFWWLSLAGTLCLLAYGIWRRDSVFIFGYAFTWIPYMRNLVISYRHHESHRRCAGCAILVPPHSNFCPACGLKLDEPFRAG